jgi:hypothetical protein
LSAGPPNLSPGDKGVSPYRDSASSE